MIEANLEEPLTLAQLSAKVGASPYHLQRTFKRFVGVTPRQYTDARRLHNLKSRLRDGEGIAAALYEVGYGSSSRLYEQTHSRLGMTPGAYRRGGQGINIAYGTFDSPLGRLLVARTERGICAVNLGESDEALVRALRKEFSKAELRRDQDGLSHAIGAIVRYLEGEQPSMDLPLDVQGTAFQYRVWNELLKISYGQTRTYGEIARALGQPQAARAVARACATNHVPLLIPCHRVVAASGQLGGYRLGAQRKRLLLDKEKRQG